MKESRLIGYNLSDFNATKPTTRDTKLNAVTQDVAHQRALVGAQTSTGTLQQAPTIDVATPGGTIGYSSAQWNPVIDATGNMTVAPRASNNAVPQGMPAGWTDVNGLSRMENGPMGAETPTQFAQRVAAVHAQNTEILKQQQLKQQQAQAQAQMTANSGAAAAAASGAVTNPLSGHSFTGATGQRLQNRLDQPVDRQQFIEQMRSQGKSDQEIRQQIATLPPEQTGGGKPQQTPTSGGQAPGGTTPGQKTGQPGQKQGEQQTQAPQAGPLDALIAGTADPQLRAVLQAMAAEAAATGYTGDPMGQAEFMQGADAKAMAQPFDAIQSIIDKAQTRLDQGEQAMKSFLDNQYARNDRYMAAQQENQLNQLTFQNDRAARDQRDVNKKTLDSQTIMLALQGGFGSADGNREISEARAKGEQAIIDLNKEFGFKKTDVSLAFTQMHNEAFDNYQQRWLEENDKFESRIADLDLQGISNQQAKSNTLSGAYKDYVNGIKEARKEYAKIVTNATGMVYDQINKERDDKRAQEELALNRIDYLLKNYPRESVAEAIKELGSKVTSFDVQALIDNPTLAEITRAEAAMKKRSSGGGGGYATSFLPAGMQEPPKPEVSLDDFMKQKMSALESVASQSFAPAKRAELMAQNADKWQKEHEAVYMSGPMGQAVGQAKSQLAQQFGQTVVDAAQLVMDGTYTGTDPVGKAAKAMGVPASQVATALTKLKQTGAVAETAILSPAQRKDRDTIISGLKTDPFYTVWNGSKSAVTRINAAIGDNGGADGLSDIMAINAFQNGIVDPGSTVKEGDVSLMQTAIAWADLVQLNYWKEKISDGDKLPASMRQKMLQLATSTRDAYGQDFQAETVPRVRSLIQQNGLPPTVLNEYLGSSTTTVSPAVSSFVDSLQF